MNKENFLEFVDHPEWWRFAKSVPNWPHFYMVEKDLPDQAAFRAARAFVRESGRVGKFFDMDVLYFDADGWTYWASPLSAGRCSPSAPLLASVTADLPPNAPLRRKRGIHGENARRSEEPVVLSWRPPAHVPT